MLKNKWNYEIIIIIFFFFSWNLRNNVKVGGNKIKNILSTLFLNAILCFKLLPLTGARTSEANGQKSNKKLVFLEYII